MAFLFLRNALELPDFVVTGFVLVKSEGLAVDNYFTCAG
jgi:hypothetical protein